MQQADVPWVPTVIWSTLQSSDSQLEIGLGESKFKLFKGEVLKWFPKPFGFNVAMSWQENEDKILANHVK